MFKIPQSNKQFKQDNSSDRLGNISQTKNISFDKKGYIKLADRTRTFASSSTLADLVVAGNNIVSAFAKDSDSTDIWALGTKNIYIASYSSPTTFVKDSAAGTPTLDISGNNDSVEFYSDMYVANGTNLVKKAGSTWGTITTTSGAVSSLCLFKNLSQLAVGGTDSVDCINTSDVIQNTLRLPADYYVTKMAWNKNRIAVGTVNDTEQKAILLIWDGLSAEANEGYEVPKGHTIYSVVPYKDGFAVVTSAGELLYNNGGWQVLDRFPIYYTNEVWDVQPSINASGRKVMPNGMETDGELIYIGISNSLATLTNSNIPTRIQNFPSGVWCYDPEVGLHHKYTIDASISLKTSAITTANVNTTTDVITVSGVTVPETGTPVYYFNGTSTGVDSSSATPLKHGKRYFTIYQSGTTLKLASTYANALDGTAIDLTGTGNNAQYLIFNKSDRFGDSGCHVTALKLVDHDVQNTTPTQIFSKLLIGGSVREDDGTSITVLASVVTDQENRGYFITPKFESTSFQDVFKNLAIKHGLLTNADDKIICKYASVDNTLQDYETYNSVNNTTTVFVDGNTFTTTLDLSNVSSGDEVEIYSSKGAGFLAHITSISEAGGTYTVNLDETVPDVTAGDLLRVYFSNWEKLFEITNSEFNSKFKTQQVSIKDTWIKLKIELRGVGTNTEEILVDNENLIA